MGPGPLIVSFGPPIHTIPALVISCAVDGPVAVPWALAAEVRPRSSEVAKASCMVLMDIVTAPRKWGIINTIQNAYEAVRVNRDSAATPPSSKSNRLGGVLASAESPRCRRGEQADDRQHAGGGFWNRGRIGEDADIRVGVR